MLGTSLLPMLHRARSCRKVTMPSLFGAGVMERCGGVILTHVRSTALTESLMSLLGPMLAAGLIAVGVTVLIERFGGVVGGLLGTLPTTIVPAAIGIWAVSADVDAFRAAMAVVPVGMAVDGLFLICWRLVPGWVGGSMRRQLIGTLLVSIGVWFVVAAIAIRGVAWLDARGLEPLVVGAVAFFALEIGGVLACRKVVPAPSGARRVGVLTLAIRGLLAGAAIGVAGLLAANGGALMAGVASVFPAIFLTTMVSVWWSQGRSVSVGAVGPMILGSGAVSAFALVAAWSIPTYGTLIGSGVAWMMAAGGVTVPAWMWLRSHSIQE